MIKAIICDKGNVLTFFDRSVMLRQLSEHSKYSPQEVESRIVHTEFDVDFHEGKITREEFFRIVSDTLGLDITMEEFRRIYNSVFLKPNEELLDALKKLKGRYRLVLLSDTNEMHVEFNRKYHSFIYDAFDDLILSNEIGLTKYRHPKEIFALAVGKAGCLPEECVFVDDMEENTNAAIKNGLKAITFVGNKELFQELERMGVRIK